MNSESNTTEFYGMFSFELSEWQKLALRTINEGNHCLVTAPTGSGKTLPAEYAIRHFSELKKKVIYTSPLKALSNQKYNDFRRQFPTISFGILTGDIKDNETADVLIMTTEILCNYLHNYKKDENERQILDFNIDLEEELGCVIFDEVHYINDVDRGTVWEESIMLMPNCVQMVMLSATIDEPERFAHWVDSTNPTKQTVICSTTERAVPLKHYLWYGVSHEMIHKKVQNKTLLNLIQSRGNKLNLLCEGQSGVFYDKVYHDVNKMKDELEYNRIMLKRSHLLTQLTSFLEKEEMLPAICFIYSRKLVETYAKELNVKLLEQSHSQKVEAECRHILTKFDNGHEYMNLPEYNMVVKLLEKGIGVHHAGLVPVLREMVEIMFSKGYVKMLFATETFAVGLNMPTKTVVFTNLRKYCGDGERYLYSHEYTQQAGRAGRRGYDTVGHVIHLTNLFEIPDLANYRGILSNKPQKIYSKFKISYSLLLNPEFKAGQDEKTMRETMIDFVRKSIVQSDIAKELKGIEHELEEVNKKVEDQKEIVRNISKLTREEYDKIKELEYCLGNGMYKNKMRKAKQNELNDLKGQSKHIERECQMYEELDKLLKEQKELETAQENCEEYIAINVKLVQDALENHGFGLSEIHRRKIASQLKETHCLAMTDLLTRSDLFEACDERTIIGVLSCFTNVNVGSDMRVSVPTSKNENVRSLIDFIYENLEKYQSYETKYGFNSGSDYSINFDVCDEMMAWCDVENAEQAISFLKSLKSEKNIFVGEFIKGVLKIVNILKELEKIFTTIVEKLEYVEKIKNCYELLLKFVCTSQSLYV